MSTKPLAAFDANVRLGRLANSRGPWFRGADELLAAMDELGVDRALVYGALAKESDVLRGNALLQEQIQGEARLIPCWVGIPNREPCRDLIARMREHSIPALRLFPQTSHFSIRPWCCEALAKALSEEGKVLMVDFDGPGWSNDGIDWEGIQQLCLAVPELKLVVCGVTMASPPNYEAFIRQCPNLHLEISELVSPGEIKRLVEAGLGLQLIFGSNLPKRHAGAALTMVGLENLKAEARDLILNGNLQRLLMLSEENEPVVPIREIPHFPDVVDTHVHFGGWNYSAAASGRPADTVRDMDRCGIQSAIVTSLWSCFGEVPLGNADVAEATKAFPGRIYGYLTLDPKHPDEFREQIDRYRGDPGFRGIKLHCGTHGIRLNDPQCREILEFANEKKIPLLIHEEFDLPEWKDLCLSHPDATFIVAHVGGGGPDHAPARELARLSRTVDNLYFDLAATRNFYGFLEDLVELAGPEKILYGSDHPLMDFGFELGQIFFSGIGEAEKQMILSGNARRIFKLN